MEELVEFWRAKLARGLQRGAAKVRGPSRSLVRGFSAGGRMQMSNLFVHGACGWPSWLRSTIAGSVLFGFGPQVGPKQRGGQIRPPAAG